MDPLRFLRKCLTNPPAAWQSAKLVGRSFYGRAHWALRPQAPLRYRLASGGELLLEPGHSFTHCFWPGVDNYEPDVHSALLHFLKPGDTFVDCGSNIGYFSVLAGSVVGSDGCVIAVEANPVTHRLLERNLKLNRLGLAVHCALMAEPGEVELFVPQDGGDVYSSVHKGGLVRGENVETIKVNGRTLDEMVASLGLDRVDVIKLDIEGAELSVLSSAKMVMRELRPVIICEYGTNTWPAFGATAEDLLKLLDECAYEVGVFEPVPSRVRLATMRDWEAPYINLVLRPNLVQSDALCAR